jgi:hypothetical protein
LQQRARDQANHIGRSHQVAAARRQSVASAIRSCFASKVPRLNRGPNLPAPQRADTADALRADQMDLPTFLEQPSDQVRRSRTPGARR